MRAAVVLFVESESATDVNDLGHMVNMALYQSGIKSDGLTLNLRGEEHRIAVHEVIEVGVAMANGYLWARATSRAFPREAEDSEAGVGA